MVVLSMIAPVAGLLPSIPSVPAQSATKLRSDKLKFVEHANRNAVSKFRPPIPLPFTGQANSPPEIRQTPESFCLESAFVPTSGTSPASKRLGPVFPHLPLNVSIRSCSCLHPSSIG